MPRRRFGGATTSTPATSSSAMTPAQLEPSTNAPWTSTTVGLPPAEVVSVIVLVLSHEVDGRFRCHHSARAVGPRCNSTPVTTTIHTRPMAGEMNCEYAPSGAQNPSLAHVVVPTSTRTTAATPPANRAFESRPARHKPNEP